MADDKAPEKVYYNVKAKWVFQELHTERAHDTDIEFILKAIADKRVEKAYDKGYEKAVEIWSKVK